jgi:hypothetical protein
MFVARTPRVDVARIVQALPVAGQPKRRTWVNWRVAAAITLLAAGGGSIAIVSRGRSSAALDSTIARTAVQKPSTNTTTVPASQPTVVVADSHRVTAPSSDSVAATVATVAIAEDAGLEMTGRLGELSDAQLEALLKEIEKMEAVPVAEPEPVILPVTTARPGRGT